MQQPMVNHVPVRFLVRSADARGGVVHSVLNLAGRLAKTHDVEVISVFRLRDTAAYAVPPGVTMTYLDDRMGAEQASATPMGLGRRVLAGTASVLVPREERMHAKSSVLTDLLMVRALRAMTPGVLITTRPSLHVVAAQFAPPGVILIAQEHMNYDTRPASLQRGLRRHAAGLDALVVLTGRDRRDYARALRRAVGGSAPPVRCIPNAAPWPLTDVDKTGRDRVVVAAGRLNHQKGFDRLIEAYESVVAEFPDWRLEIYGEGVDRNKLQRRIDARGLNGNVALLGFTTQLQQVMRRASIFALSSRFEGLPMVGIEALGQGLPIVAFDCPRGPRELVRDNRNGFLVADGDVEAFGSALRRLMADDELRGRLGARARTDAEAYDIERVVARWERLFEAVLSRRTSGDRLPQRRIAWPALRAAVQLAASERVAPAARSPDRGLNACGDGRERSPSGHHADPAAPLTPDLPLPLHRCQRRSPGQRPLGRTAVRASPSAWSSRRP